MLWIYFPLTQQSTGSDNIQTTVQTSKYPVFHVNFPSIALCNENLINWEKISQAEEIFLPNNYSKALSRNFREFVGYLSSFRFDNLDDLHWISRINLEELQNINITDLIDFLSFDCEDILANCLWIHNKHDCCRWFVKERTEKGFCLVFNSLITETSKQKIILEGKYYPLKDSKTGLFHGLQLDVLLNKNKTYYGLNKRSGIFVMLKRPQDWSHRSHYQVPGNSQFKFIITPEVTQAELAVKSYDPLERWCLFDVTKKLFFLIKTKRNIVTGRCSFKILFQIIIISI